MREIPPSETLLTWYDSHARDLPWRVPPKLSVAGTRPDPYRVWMSEVMLQQTTVAAVKDYFARFTQRWPTVQDLAAAKDADVMAAWAGLGYYARARSLLKCARQVVADYGGVFPETQEELIKLPGIGPYTSAAIASIAFGQPATVMDGNVERVMARMFDLHTPLPKAKPVLFDRAQGLTPTQRAGDYAQAVMDLGATICTPRNPACGICPWMDICAARKAGTAAELPKKEPKKPKPTRVGVAYVTQRADGAYLLERRADKGLLGGMLGWPGSDWAEVLPDHTPPLPAQWETCDVTAKHTFTHFHLLLTVNVARVADGINPERGEFIEVVDFDPKTLPTVMRKAFDVAQSSGKLMA